MASARLSWGIVGLRMANCRAYSNEFMMPIPEVWLRQTVGVLICSPNLFPQMSTLLLAAGLAIDTIYKEKK